MHSLYLLQGLSHTFGIVADNFKPRPLPSGSWKHRDRETRARGTFLYPFSFAGSFRLASFARNFHYLRPVPSEVVLNEDDGIKSPCAVNLHNAVTVSQQRLGKRVAQLSPARMNEVCAALLSRLRCKLVTGKRFRLSPDFGRPRIPYGVPVPANGTSCGLPPPSSLTEISAVRLPCCEGVKVTLIRQYAPDARPLPQLFC